MDGNEKDFILPYLKINKVKDMATFRVMQKNGVINPNELYLVGEEEIKIIEE